MRSRRPTITAIPPDYDLSVPGTTLLLDERAESTGNDNFTLVPAPSTDPNDPLNWSQKRKWLHLFCIVLYVACAAFCLGCLYAIYGPMIEATGLTLEQINSGVGFGYLFLGLGACLSLPLMLAIGKRPVYLMSIFGAVIYPFCISLVRTYSAWIGLCICNGIILSPFFVAPEVSLSDVFFYHERALPFGIYIAWTYGGAVLAPVFSGYIYDGVGWRGPPYVFGAFTGCCAIFLFFFLEETNFKREESQTIVIHDNDHDHVHTPSDAALEKNVSIDTKPGIKDDGYPQPDVVTVVNEVGDDGAAATNGKGPGGRCDKAAEVKVGVHSYDRITTPWPGPRPLKMFTISPYAGGIMLRGIVQPVLMWRLPIVLWCGLVFSLYQIFFNIMAALTSGVLSAEPYNFSPNLVGLTFISPLLAIVPGAIAGGYVSDRFTIFQARKHGGISEPEHKLKLFIIPSLLVPFGLLMIGLGPYYGAHWMVFVAGEFVLTVAGPLATLLSITYAFDSFHSIKPLEREGPRADVQPAATYLLSLILFAMCATFGFNYIITPWAFDWGFRNFAISAVFVASLINFTCFLMYRYGKRLRKSGAPAYSRIINW